MTAAPRNPLCVDSMVSCDRIWYAGKCAVASIRKACCAKACTKAYTKASPVLRIKLSGDGRSSACERSRVAWAS